MPVYTARSVAVVVEAYANTGDVDRWRAALGSVPISTFVLLPLWILCWRATVNAEARRG